MKYKSVATKRNSTLREYSPEEIAKHLKMLEKETKPRIELSEEEKKRRKYTRYKKWLKENRKYYLAWKREWTKKWREKGKDTYLERSLSYGKLRKAKGVYRTRGWG